MKILVFGNPLLENDSLPIKLLPRLKERFPDITFQEIDPTENLENQGRNLTIIDSVEGIKEIIVIDSIERLESGKIYTMHDFDLAYNLKILKKLNLIDSVRIIGVPMGMGGDEAFSQIQLILRKWAAQLIQGS